MSATYFILHQNNSQGSKAGYDSGPFLEEKLTQLHGRAVYAIILQCSCKLWYSQMGLFNFIWINVQPPNLITSIRKKLGATGEILGVDPRAGTLSFTIFVWIGDSIVYNIQISHANKLWA